MGSLVIEPGKLRGTVKIPPSKSMAHRAVICGALASGESVIRNIERSDDIKATIGAMEALGASIRYDNGALTINGLAEKAAPEGETAVDCNESGSTLRFLIPIALARGQKVRLSGRGNLWKRPLDPYFEIMEEQGIAYKLETGERSGLSLNGTLKPGHFRLRGDLSSQFITGLLFALPLLSGDSRISITTKLESRQYIDLTLELLTRFGIGIEYDGEREFYIKGNQRFKSTDYEIEGDYSQAVFFLAAGALGHEIEISGLKPDSLQGDRAAVDILKAMGAETKLKNGVMKTNPGKLSGTVIDASQCPDLMPVLSAVCALAEGVTEIINAGRLRIKECDRLSAICTELSKLGADIEEYPDRIRFRGVKTLRGGVTVSSHKDHRIAMMLALAASVCEKPVVLTDYECVSKSYPRFFNDFAMLGGKIHEQRLG